jgi:phosphotransferase system HPr (HPr) family protein
MGDANSVAPEATGLKTRIYQVCLGSSGAGMRREVEIVNKLGLHARPAARFVRWVNRFKSTITIWKGEEKFSAASLLEVLTANLNYGARVVLEAIGPDEHEALNKLELLLLGFRDEERGQTSL